MHDLYAKGCGYEFFTVIDNKKEYKIYKFSYYWSNVGEAYVIVLSQWLPEDKRKRLPKSRIAPNGPKWISPTIVHGMQWGVDSRPVIKEIEKQLKSNGKANLDETLGKEK